MYNRSQLNVVICTYNRAASLKRTLASLEVSRTPAHLQWEVIVVDNNSKDDTKAVVESFRQRGTFRIRYLKEESQGISYARNRGINESTAELIAFTDDDVVVEPDWIANIVQGFAQYDVQCIGGRILPIWEIPKPKWLSEYFHHNLALLDYGDTPFYVVKPNLWGANLAFRAEAFDKYGLFDTNRGRQPRKLYGEEESHFLEKLLEQNEKVLYHPHVVVHHCIGRNRMTKAYFRKWNYHQGELEGVLSGETGRQSIGAITYFAFKGLSASLYYFAVSFCKTREESFEYQRKAALRLGYTKGRIGRLR